MFQGEDHRAGEEGVYPAVGHVGAQREVQRREGGGQALAQTETRHVANVVQASQLEGAEARQGPRPIIRQMSEKSGRGADIRRIHFSYGGKMGGHNRRQTASGGFQKESGREGQEEEDLSHEIRSEGEKG